MDSPRVSRAIGLAAFLSLVGWPLAPSALAAQVEIPPRVDSAQVDSARVQPVDLNYMRLSQAYIDLPAARIYIDARSSDGQLARGLRAEQLTATVGSEVVPIARIQPFNTLNEGTAYIFLVDVSKSLRPEQFTQMQEAMRSWVTSIGPRDQAAILTIGNDVQVGSDFTADTAALAASVESLARLDDQTSLYDGLARAIEMSRRADEDLPARRVIVILSDGHDDVLGGMTHEEVLERVNTDPVPVYAIGLYQPPHTEWKEQGLRTLGTLARASGGILVRADTMPLSEIYEALRGRTREVFVAELSCGDCPRDGSVYRLQLTARTGTRTLTDGLDVRFLPQSPIPRSEPDTRFPLWMIGFVGAVLLALLGSFLLRGKRRRAGVGGVARVEENTTPELREAVVPMLDADARRPAPAPHVRLIPLGVNSPGEAQTVTLDDQIRIGRNSSEADVTLPHDPEISGAHCTLIRRDSGVLIRDLDSTNGTRVNGVPIQGEHPVEDNDVIGIGRSELRLCILGDQP